MAQFIERLASRLFHRCHRPPGGLRVAGGNRLGSARLHRHQTHLMGHDVVQLACDTRSLLGHRAARFAFLLPFELRGTLLEESQVVTTNPDTTTHVPHQEQDDESASDVLNGFHAGEFAAHAHGDSGSQPGVAPAVVRDIAAHTVERDRQTKIIVRVA